MSSGAKRDIGMATDTPEPAVGFHAQLHGASLWDLVQMECLARSRRVVEVAGEGGVGYLYFDGGRVVHASTPRNRGTSAAFEILGWTHGTFQASNRSWPSMPTIEMSPESLLLHAAKQQDEQHDQRDKGASNLVAFPGRSVEAAGDLLEEIELLEIGEDDHTAAREPATGEQEGEMNMRTPNTTNTDETPAPPPLAQRAENAADFPVMVRLSANGAVLRNKGGSEELAEATAYAHRLVQLTGELLGLEEFVSLECTFANERFLVFAEGDGDIVALRPRPDLNLQALRERLGL